MRVLITGGAGFVGSHIVDYFFAQGADVDIVDNLSTGDRANIHCDTEFYHCNFGDVAVEEILNQNRYDIVCHFGAQIDLRKSVKDPSKDMETDVLGSVRFLQQAAKSGVKHVVFASSGGAIYGEQNQFPADESHTISPESPYGIHKWMIEKYLQYFHKVNGMKYTALRYANIYGPRQNSKSEAGVISIFMNKLLNDEAAVINGTGEQTRDFVFVLDAVKAIGLAIEEGYCGELNIGTSVETSINVLFEEICKALKIAIEAGRGPGMPGEQMRSVLDAAKAGSEIGWSPDYTLAKGLELTANYFKEEA